MDDKISNPVNLIAHSFISSSSDSSIHSFIAHWFNLWNEFINKKISMKTWSNQWSNKNIIDYIIIGNSITKSTLISKLKYEKNCYEYKIDFKSFNPFVIFRSRPLNFLSSQNLLPSDNEYFFHIMNDIFFAYAKYSFFFSLHVYKT